MGETVPETGEFLEVSIWREQDGDGHFESFQVPRRDNQTILDVVAWVQQQADPTLSYRFACRVGMCGSCAMMVNGAPRWTCRTHVQKVAEDNRLEIAPLRNLPVIKDLAVDMDPFFDKWVAAEAVFEQARHAMIRWRQSAQKTPCGLPLVMRLNVSIVLFAMRPVM